MAAKKHKIIALSIMCILIVICIVYSVFSGSYSEIDEGTLGNTAGNLNNYGLFCEINGEIYFANTYDNYALYKMNSDTSELKKINDLAVKYINAGGKYVFFYGNSSSATSGLGSIVAKPGMYMLSKGGKKIEALTKDVSQNMLLVGNNIYYQHYTEKAGVTFAKIDLKKKKSTEILDYMINPSSYGQGNFYFNGMYKDHYLYSYNPATDAVETVWEGDIWFPIYQDGYVYYVDVLNNYRLCRYSIAENTIEILTKERLDFYNLYGNIIYYQVSSSSEPCLKRMALDGSSQEVVASGIYSTVSITSNYTFFTSFDGDCPIYYTPTFGGVNVQEFVAARDILMQKKSK